MIKNFLIYTFLFWIVLLNSHFAEAKTKHEILGLRVGMSKEEALNRLQEIGSKERDERKQQEIWNLTNDKHYSYIIIAFDKDNTKVRFITAKAREGGKRVRYRDVIDIKKARQEGVTNNYKYVLEVPARSKELGYKVVARGRDKEYLTYFSIEELEIIAPK
jgi:hypothetical protein